MSQAELPITVIIPVGRGPYYASRLPICLASVKKQTDLPNQILLIDDAADLPSSNEYDVYTPPWRLGYVGAINCGVGLARNEVCFILCSDDEMEVDCLKTCYSEYLKHANNLGYYWCCLTYPDGSLSQSVTLSALFHKDLWRRSDGLPVEGAIGAAEQMFASLLLGRPEIEGVLINVADGRPLLRFNLDPRQHSQHQGNVDKRGHWMPFRDWVPRYWRSELDA